MNYEELDELFRLQRQAYGCLLWIKQLMHGNASLQADLKAGRFADAGFCRDWVVKNLNSLPSDLRPEASRVEAFARLLGSFFQTSFRVGVRRLPDEVRVTLNAGLKPQAGRKHQARVLARTLELKRYALVDLAADNHVGLPDRLFDSELPDDSALWAYACELKRRTEFGSQGEAVHLLWQELDERIRTRLTAEVVWKARERLIEWMKKQETK
jgi:hypothetical protein